MSPDRAKITNGFVHNSGAKPSGQSVGGINQIGRRDANSNLVGIGVVHENLADGSARASNGDCRLVGGAGCKS